MRLTQSVNISLIILLTQLSRYHRFDGWLIPVPQDGTDQVLTEEPLRMIISHKRSPVTLDKGEADLQTKIAKGSVDGHMAEEEAQTAIGGGGDGCSFASIPDDPLLTHWDNVYVKDSTQDEREWHCGYARAKADALANYLAAVDGRLLTATAASSHPAAATSTAKHDAGVVVDIGCGGSSIGLQMLNEFAGLTELIMTDISPTIVKRYVIC
jgi:hypothetical protein